MAVLTELGQFMVNRVLGSLSKPALVNIELKTLVYVDCTMYTPDSKENIIFQKKINK
jgi:hypothetical protein